LIVSDLIGQFQVFTPKFVKKYCDVATIITDAMKAYCEDVREGIFPEDQHCYHMVDGEKEKKAFVAMDDYCKSILGNDADASFVDSTNAVILEISAMQFFPWLMAQARQAIEKKELMPGRIIRVRNMAEQVEDNGDIVATALAMQIIGATYVESLDTRGTDGSNIHLGGPDTITGYFGGIGQPNDYPIK